MGAGGPVAGHLSGTRTAAVQVCFASHAQPWCVLNGRGVSCPGLGVVESGTPAPMTWKQRFTGQPQAGEKHLERGRFSTVPVLQQPCNSRRKQASSPLKGFMMCFQSTLG